MPASAPSSSEHAVHNSGAKEVLQSVTSQAHVIGLTIVGAGIVLGCAAALTGLIFTAPSAGPCFPPGGGTNIPCPASPLTTNNLFVVLALEIASLAFFALGIVVLMMIWFREHPVEAPTKVPAGP